MEGSEGRISEQAKKEKWRENPLSPDLLSPYLGVAAVRLLASTINGHNAFVPHQHKGALSEDHVRSYLRHHVRSRAKRGSVSA